MSERAELSISHAIGEESWLLTVVGERGACTAPDDLPADSPSVGCAGHPVTCSTERLGPVITVPADSVSDLPRSALPSLGGAPCSTQQLQSQGALLAPDELRQRVMRSRARQGLPPVIEDLAVIERAARVFTLVESGARTPRHGSRRSSRK